MEELDAGIRDLHDRVGRLDDLLREHQGTSDWSERLGAAAHEAAERTRLRLRWLLIAGLAVAFVWTPLTAWGAVWVHEYVRNHCYPVAVWTPPPPSPDTQGEPWVCHLFPGTSAAHPGH